jgi:hypothetical protein
MSVYPVQRMGVANQSGWNMDITIPNLLDFSTILLPTDIPLHPLHPLNQRFYIRLEVVCDYWNPHTGERGY